MKGLHDNDIMASKICVVHGLNGQSRVMPLTRSEWSKTQNNDKQ